MNTEKVAKQKAERAARMEAEDAKRKAGNAKPNAKGCKPNEEKCGREMKSEDAN